MLQNLLTMRLKNEGDREFRRQTAQTKGLDRNTTWSTIIEFNAEQERKELATYLGLCSNATWREIVKANDENILAMSPFRQ